MSTEFVFMQGKVKYARLNIPNKWGKYSITLYLNATSLEKLRELQSEGVKNVIKKDEDGYYASFNRPQSKEIRGKVVGMAPPEVLNPDKTPLRDVLIGAGSDVTVKLEVYSHGTPTGGKAKASRLLSVKVDTLVPFDLSRDFDDEQQRAVKGLDAQPKQEEELF